MEGSNLLISSNFGMNIGHLSFMRLLGFIVLLSLICLPGWIKAIELSALGEWVKIVGSTELIMGAGSELRSSYMSAENATTLNINRARGKDYYWRVEVKRIDVNWPSGLTLYVRRTSDGIGYGSISGGTTFIPISSINQIFFEGSDNRSSINCQYKLDGVSIDISPGSYITTIIYTVIGKY